MLELAEKAFDEVALSVKPLAEAWSPPAVGFGGDVGRGALRFDQRADAVRVIGLVSQHDGARGEAIEQGVGDLAVMRLAGGQAEPDRKPLGIDDGVDLGREPAPRTTETMISTPLFAVGACWCAWMEVLSIIWMSPS